MLWVPLACGLAVCACAQHVYCHSTCQPTAYVSNDCYTWRRVILLTGQISLALTANVWCMIQVCIHTSAPQNCHSEDYYTHFCPVVGTAVTRHLLAMLLNSTHSCSRHGAVATRFTSERPGSVIPLSKNIYCPWITFIAAVGTARSLLGSLRNGQAALYLF